MWCVKAFGGCAIGALFGVALILSLSGVCDVVSAQYAEEGEFVAWYNASMSQIESDALKIVNAIENYDCAGCEAWAGSSYDDATRMLSELGTYEVSADLQPVKTHVKQALEDFRQACYHTEQGARMYDAAELQSAASYVSRVLTQFEQIDALGLVPPTPAAALKTLQGALEQAAEMVGGAHTPSPTPREISVDEAYQRLQERPEEITLLDVRVAATYDSEHIPGAINIPLKELESRLGELDPSKEIIVYCQVGGTSAIAADILVQNGFEDVYTITGGINAWKQKYPTTLSAPSPTGAPEGAIVAPAFTLTSAEGTTFSLSDFRGKVVVLTLILTTCHLCQEEMAELAYFHETHPEVVVISVSIDPLETDENLRSFKETYNADWLFARDTEDLAHKYQGYVLATPTVVVITPQGYISFRRVDVVHREELSSIVESAYREEGELIPSPTPAPDSGIPGFEAGAVFACFSLLVGLRWLGKRSRQ
jgi:rhodanese-related sulfurtransferase/peroxiredoxin